MWHSQETAKSWRRNTRSPENNKGLKEEVERMWELKAAVIPVVLVALGTVFPKLGEWLQQIPATTSEISVQKSAVLGTAKILRRIIKLPGKNPVQKEWDQFKRKKEIQ